MSSTSTTRATSDDRTLLERLRSLRLPPPAIVAGLLIGCVVLLRLPSALVPREFNVDESQLLAEAMKFVVDPRPWKGVDSCGPLSSYLISIFLLMGFKASYVLAHMLAALLICLQVLVAYLTLRRLGSDKTAAFGAFLLAFLYGTYTHTHYLHYNTESLPTLFLMTGFYIFLAWLAEPPDRHPGVQLSLLFLCGLALGSAPWAKLQALPITGALGLLTVAVIFRARSPVVSPPRRVTELAVFGCGAVLTTCILLAAIAGSGAIKDFWYSYILAPLGFVGALSWATTLENLARVFVVTPVHQLLLVAAVGLALLDYSSATGDIRLAFKGHRWAFSGLLVYAAAGLFTACRSNNFWPKHAIFFIPPMSYIAVLLAAWGMAALLQQQLSPQRPKERMLLGLLFPLVLLTATVALYSAYIVRYVHKIRAIPELKRVEPDSVRLALPALDRRKTDSNDGSANLETTLVSCAGPPNWDLPDEGKERMLAIVDEIRKTKPVRSLAIWGWEPGMYVLTGIPPATRDTITERAIDPGPLRHYFQTRYADDLRAYPPDLFIDTVAKGAFMWREWTENDGYESNPELRRFIDDSYVLVGELVLVKGAKPVRFFARRK